MTDITEFFLRRYTLVRFPEHLPVKAVPSEIYYGGKLPHLILNCISFIRHSLSLQSILPIPSPPRLYTLLPSYDFIVIGSGSGGAVVAGRLANTHPNVTVLLIEAGGPAVDGVTSPELLPLGVLSNQNTERDWKYRTVPQATACLAQPERVSYWPRGRILGGTSVLNFMIYHRGHPSDFDIWAECVKDDFWNAKSVAHRFKAIENVLLDDRREGKIPRPTRGTSGPIPVSVKRPLSIFSKAFLQAARAMGFRDATNYNSWENTVGAGPLELNKDPATGQRVTSYRAYIHHKTVKGLLHILPYAHVTKIILDDSNNSPPTSNASKNNSKEERRHSDKGEASVEELSPKAVGVEFTLVPPSVLDSYTENDLVKRRRQVVNAKKEIVLSAGSIGTPQILMLSGIGPSQHLNKHNISVAVDLQGVGENLMDHIFFPAMFSPQRSSKIRSELLSFRNALKLSPLIQYLSQSRGMLASPGCDVQLVVPHLASLEPRRLPEAYSNQDNNINRNNSDGSRPSVNRFIPIVVPTVPDYDSGLGASMCPRIPEIADDPAAAANRQGAAPDSMSNVARSPFVVPPGIDNRPAPVDNDTKVPEGQNTESIMESLLSQQPDLQLLLYGGVPDIFDLRGKMNIASDSPLRFGRPSDWGIHPRKIIEMLTTSTSSSMVMMDSVSTSSSPVSPSKTASSSSAVSPVSETGAGIANENIEKLLNYLGSNIELVMMLPVLLHPESRGTIRLKSSNPFSHPVIDPNYLSDRRDVLGLVEGVKIARQFMTTKEWTRVIRTFLSPNCPPPPDALSQLPLKVNMTRKQQLNRLLDDDDDTGVKASNEDDQDGAIDSTRIPVDQRAICTKYDPNSDEFLEQIVRLQTLTLYHPVGTCRMGVVSDKMACVDSLLQVRGVRNLRVADASVFPTQTSGNTQLPVMMVAETLAQLLTEAHKLSNG